MSEGRDRLHSDDELDIAFRRELLGELSAIRINTDHLKDQFRYHEERLEDALHEIGHIKDHQTELAFRFTDPSALRPNGLRRKRVLVVEDELSLCDSLCEMLTRLGIYASRAHTRLTAEQVLLASGPFDAAIIDLRIPKTQEGLELYRHMSRFYPNVAVVLMSGRIPEGAELLPVVLLCKPFGPRKLLAALNEALHDDIPSTRRTEPPPKAPSEPEPTPLPSGFIPPVPSEPPSVPSTRIATLEDFKPEIPTQTSIELDAEPSTQDETPDAKRR